MPRYIDAEKIKFDLTGLIYIAPTDIRKIGAYFIRQLKDMPIADVVEVVRCKDCEHYDAGLCRRWKYSHVTSEDSFCSGAERRTDATD